MHLSVLTLLMTTSDILLSCSSTVFCKGVLCLPFSHVEGKSMLVLGNQE